MNLEKIIEIRNKAEATKNKINSLLLRHKQLRQIIQDTNSLKQYAGEMIFTGRTGRTFEPRFLQQVRINDVAGCVVIPEHILQLADREINKIEEELEAFTGKEE